MPPTRSLPSIERTDTVERITRRFDLATDKLGDQILAGRTSLLSTLDTSFFVTLLSNNFQSCKTRAVAPLRSTGLPTSLENAVFCWLGLLCIELLPPAWTDDTLARLAMEPELMEAVSTRLVPVLLRAFESLGHTLTSLHVPLPVAQSAPSLPFPSPAPPQVPSLPPPLHTAPVAYPPYGGASGPFLYPPPPAPRTARGGTQRPPPNPPSYELGPHIRLVQVPDMFQGIMFVICMICGRSGRYRACPSGACSSPAMDMVKFEAMGFVVSNPYDHSIPGRVEFIQGKVRIHVSWSRVFPFVFFLLFCFDVL